MTAPNMTTPDMNTPKRLIELLDAPPPHWVGDGFPVRTMFSVHTHDPATLSPFLLLDHGGPHTFDPEPGGRPRGVDEHPHRGFETVTIVHQGELEHRDSSGYGGRIGPGDVQWMTAGSGLVHEEKHSLALTRRGGVLEMIQLWVNLPARAKMTEPRYQAITDAAIPRAALPGDAGTVRVIAGNWADQRGPARTVTPMNVWDIQLHAAANAELRVPDGHNTIVLALRGDVTINDAVVRSRQCALLSGRGSVIELCAADADAALLLLSGQPIDEPVAAQGPFVMNTPEQIRQAITDFRSGRMGRLTPDST
jgi:quercetin 2,3-dioxygenase